MIHLMKDDMWKVPQVALPPTPRLQSWTRSAPPPEHNSCLTSSRRCGCKRWLLWGAGRSWSICIFPELEADMLVCAAQLSLKKGTKLYGYRAVIFTGKIALPEASRGCPYNLKPWTRRSGSIAPAPTTIVSHEACRESGQILSCNSTGLSIANEVSDKRSIFIGVTYF